VSISKSTHPKPRCRCVCRPPDHVPARGSCTRQCRESRRRSSRLPSGRRGGMKADPDRSLPRLRAFARPKSSTLTTPSGVILMLEGLRSRWMIPARWAASSASAICLRDGHRSSSGNGAPTYAIVQSVALDQLERPGPVCRRCLRSRRSPRCAGD
jgi:hypothetical protein